MTFSGKIGLFYHQEGNSKIIEQKYKTIITKRNVFLNTLNTDNCFFKATALQLDEETLN